MSLGQERHGTLDLGSDDKNTLHMRAMTTVRYVQHPCDTATTVPCTFDYSASAVVSEVLLRHLSTYSKKTEIS